MGQTSYVLCAGAAQALIKGLQGEFERQSASQLSAKFGAVGAVKEALLGGVPCDVMVVTEAMVQELIQAKQLEAPAHRLGTVLTGLAVPNHAKLNPIDSADALAAFLLGAEAIFFPDPLRATAGIHFASVMKRLGVYEALESRFRTFPNGATAMQAMAKADAQQNWVGCTQVSEIMYTPGIQLVGPLPEEFKLATVYSAARTMSSANPSAAQQLLDLLSGQTSLALRRGCGFIV